MRSIQNVFESVPKKAEPPTECGEASNKGKEQEELSEAPNRRGRCVGRLRTDGRGTLMSKAETELSDEPLKAEKLEEASPQVENLPLKAEKLQEASPHVENLPGVQLTYWMDRRYKKGMPGPACMKAKEEKEGDEVTWEAAGAAAGAESEGDASTSDEEEEDVAETEKAEDDEEEEDASRTDDSDCQTSEEEG